MTISNGIEQYSEPCIVYFCNLNKLSTMYQFSDLSDFMALQALLHASVSCNRKLVVDWVPAGDLEEAAKDVSTVLSF